MSHLRSSSKLLLVLRLHLLFSSSSSLTSSVLRDVICPLVTSSFSLQWSPWKRFAPSCLFQILSVWSLESLVLSRLLFTSISSVEMMKGIPGLCLKYNHRCALRLRHWFCKTSISMMNREAPRTFHKGLRKNFNSISPPLFMVTHGSL